VETASLITKLQDMIVKSDDHNTRPTLQRSAKVKIVNPESGQILLEDGTLVEADIIVAADGIHV
jgi:2-polyprenyl-6-methoxyphenol hydroxylase-like FAD-dependent oxidoreductase